jgi:hypothetical protein
LLYHVFSGYPACFISDTLGRKARDFAPGSTAEPYALQLCLGAMNGCSKQHMQITIRWPGPPPWSELQDPVRVRPETFTPAP